MKKLVTYDCVDRYSGNQNITRQYIVNDESEALRSLYTEMEEDEDLEIKKINITELTDEEVAELMMMMEDDSDDNL